MTKSFYLEISPNNIKEEDVGKHEFYLIADDGDLLTNFIFSLEVIQKQEFDDEEDSNLDEEEEEASALEEKEAEKEEEKQESTAV